MANYSRKMKYCPQCKSKLKVQAIDEQRVSACIAASCDYVFLDNPLPIAGGIVETSEGVVLARNSAWKEEVYSIITGFINSNESPEKAVKRECQEELGLTSTNVSLVGVYSFQVKNQIIIVYHVETTEKAVLNHELSAYKIFSKSDLQAWPLGQNKLEGWQFGCGGSIGDPACDLVIAWTYLSGKAREIFISKWIWILIHGFVHVHGHFGKQHLSYAKFQIRTALRLVCKNELLMRWHDFIFPVNNNLLCHTSWHILL